MVTSAQVVETSINVTNNSPSRDYSHQDDQTTQTTETPGFKPFTIFCYPAELSFTFFCSKAKYCSNSWIQVSCGFAQSRISNNCASEAKHSITYLFLLVSLTPLKVQTASQSEDTPKVWARNLKFKFRAKLIIHFSCHSMRDILKEAMFTPVNKKKRLWDLRFHFLPCLLPVFRKNA